MDFYLKIGLAVLLSSQAPLHVHSVVQYPSSLPASSVVQYPSPPAPYYGINIGPPPYPVAVPRAPEHVLHLGNINNDAIPPFDLSPLFNIIAKVVQELKDKVPKLFDRIIDISLPNAPAQGQKSLTWIREILAAISNPDVEAIVPQDVNDRVNFLKSRLLGKSIGSYTDPRGQVEIRKHVEEFIWRRDYVYANASTIFLANGGIEALRDVLALIGSWRNGNSKINGILTPGPNCLFLNEVIHSEFICRTAYRLDENNNWALSREALQSAYDEQSRICNPVAILVVNPGVATGHMHNRTELETIVNFAYDNELVIISFEVNQFQLIDPDANYIAIRKVAAEMGKWVEVVSILSATTGPYNEPGLRGAVYEFFYFDPAVVAAWLETVRYLKFCPNTVGQVLIDALVDPPRKGDPSYLKWDSERNHYLTHIRRNTEIALGRILEIQGLNAPGTEAGALIIVKIDLPAAFIQAAAVYGLSPDLFWVLELVRIQGVITNPGSWLDQPDGYWFTFNVVGDPKDVRIALDRIEDFQKYIQVQYGGAEPSSTPVYYASE